MSAVARRPGRPRDPGVEGTILDATVELLSEGGLEAATIAAVADRSGVARATIYLRWPTRDALITAALRHAIGREPYPLSGDIEADIRRGGEQTRAILSEPAFVKFVPAVIRALLAPGRSPPSVTFDALFPNRRRLAEEYTRLARDQGFRNDIDVQPAIDSIIGGLLVDLLATRTPPSKVATARTVELVLAALRAVPRSK